jgi:hypothetical protein
MTESATTYTSKNNEATFLLDTSTLEKALMEQFRLTQMDLEEVHKRHRRNVAKHLMASGITLIPSDRLQDHEYVVSRGVYDAAKKYLMEGD